jgi:inorganic triphosphatase YgiF
LRVRKAGDKHVQTVKAAAPGRFVPVNTGASEIEFAVDRGNIKAGRRSSRIEEMELELKSGRPADLFHLAKTMEKRSQAELYLRSKSEQG